MTVLKKWRDIVSTVDKYLHQSKLEKQKKVDLAYNEYEKITQPAYDKYEKIRQPAYDEYLKITQPAYDEYDKIRQSAWIETLDKLETATCTLDFEKGNKISISGTLRFIREIITCTLSDPGTKEFYLTEKDIARHIAYNTLNFK
jgi:hypothetical protein